MSPGTDELVATIDAHTDPGSEPEVGPSEAKPADSSGADEPVRHGNTMADLEALTRRAALQSRWRFIGFDERADVARFGIVEHLLTTTDRSGFWELVNAGTQEIRKQVEAEEHWGDFWVTRTVEPFSRMVRSLRNLHSTTAPTRSPESRNEDVLARQHTGQQMPARRKDEIAELFDDWPLEPPGPVFPSDWHSEREPRHAVPVGTDALWRTIGYGGLARRP